jgi:hypothetical protein
MLLRLAARSAQETAISGYGPQDRRWSSPDIYYTVGQEQGNKITQKWSIVTGYLLILRIDLAFFAILRSKKLPKKLKQISYYPRCRFNSFNEKNKSRKTSNLFQEMKRARRMFKQIDCYNLRETSRRTIGETYASRDIDGPAGDSRRRRRTRPEGSRQWSRLNNVKEDI